MPFSLLVNGAEHRIDVPPDESLLSVLRNRLDLTGTKYGCGEGQCGACTVLVEGKPVRSCRMNVSSAAGQKITTIEGENRRLRQLRGYWCNGDVTPNDMRIPKRKLLRPSFPLSHGR